MERFELPALYPQHPDETAMEWTTRVLTHAREHGTNRQCSIGWHEECSDPRGESCQCLCHDRAAQTYSIEGHPEGDKQVVTRAEEGQIRMPPVEGEPAGTWAEWILGYSVNDAKERAIKKQEARNA